MPDLRDLRKEKSLLVRGENIATHLSLCPPLAKGGSGGISEAAENPPKSPFLKGGLHSANSEG